MRRTPPAVGQTLAGSSHELHVFPGPQVRGTLRRAQGRLGDTLIVACEGRRDRDHPPVCFALG
jgi:hypothetical protein